MTHGIEDTDDLDNSSGIPLIVAIHNSISSVDRYLHFKNFTDQTLGDKAESLIQLLGLTALYVACKNEGCKCNLELFRKLGSGRFTENDITSMEVDLMFSLKWLMNPPLPQEFLEFFTCHISKYTNNLNHRESFIRIIQDVSNYIIEVLTQFNTFQYDTASVLGAVATLIAFEGIKSSIMSSSRKQEVRALFFRSLIQLQIVSPLKTVNSMLSPLDHSCCSSQYSSQQTTIDDVLNIENEVRALMFKQCSRMEEIYNEFDPDQLFYDSRSACEPPKLL